MKSKFNKSERGFTIIEVVLVLAIGGLIFMVVFLALPGLQAGQRDTQRKQVLSSAAATITTYQSNNKGKLPAFGAPVVPTDGTFKTWMSSTASFQDPKTTEEYKIDLLANSTAKEYSAMGFDIIFYSKGAKCGNTGIVEGDSASSIAAIALKLENGSGICQEI